MKLKQKTLQEKLVNPYKVRSTNVKSVKDVDLAQRTVTGVFNSCFFIDHDLDMLLPGAANKSIQERGINSTKGNKIKHLKDHDWSKNIARLDVLEERKVDINGKEITGIYHESYYPNTQDSTDLLIKIQEGMYDARSIGFQYVNIVLCRRDGEDEDARKNWDTYLPLAINPEVAEEHGHFWVVKEIKLWEGSDVAFGANQLTPMLGVKGVTKDLLVNQLYSKLDTCYSLAKNGNLSDEGFHSLDMEIKQIKSYIATVIENQAPKKETEQQLPPTLQGTESKSFFESLMKF